MQTTDTASSASLQSRGFLLLPSFFSHTDLQALIAGFESTSTRSKPGDDVKFASRKTLAILSDKLAPVTARIERETDIRVDLKICGVYFDTLDIARWKTPPSFHQDHDGYYLFQNVAHYLNFYIPIIKPDPEKSNLSLVPFDLLQARDPRTFARLMGRGASRLRPLKSGQTQVLDDALGDRWLMNCPVQEIAITPTLHAGDLLIMRGDLIHKTQDSDSRRVAISFRMTNSTQIVRKRNFLQGSRKKLSYMIEHRNHFIKALRSFPPLGELTVGEIHSSLQAKTGPVTTSRFLLTLLYHKLCLYLQPSSSNRMTTVAPPNLR